MTSKFVELRSHSGLSLGHAIGTVERHIKAAEVLGHSHVCFTEINTMRGLYQIYKATSKSDVSPIYGLELSLSVDHRAQGMSEEEKGGFYEQHDKKRVATKAIAKEERARGTFDTWRIVARAKDTEGLENLYKLSSLAWTAGAFRQRRGSRWITTPRIDMEMLREFHEGIIFSFGGPEDVFGKHLASGNMDSALDQLTDIHELVGDNLYLEIHPHSGIYRNLNEAIVMASGVMDIPLIACNDVRYPEAEDVEAHTVLLCLNRRTNFDDPRHPTSPPGYHLRSGQEMFDAFGVHHPDIDSRLILESINRTTEVAERCKASPAVNALDVKIPSVSDEDPSIHIRRLCADGWKSRNIMARAFSRGVPLKMYEDQLERELSHIDSMGFASYFLVVHDLISWARDQGIMIGPGRGSGVGSLVCFLLEITALDPLEHELMFERFISPGRQEMPDLDIDFQKTRREEVVNYLIERYGKDRTAMIATFIAMHGKTAVKDVGNVLGLSFAATNAVTTTFPDRQGDEDRPVREVLSGSKAGKQFIEDHPQALPLIERLEGNTRQLGIHPAGVIVSPRPIREFCPVEIAKGGVQITALDMKGVEQFGMLKVDVLALRHLDILADVRGKVLERHGIDLDFETMILYSDADTLKGFSDKEFVGLFQFDSSSARSLSEGVSFYSFVDVLTLNAVNRPGCTRSGLSEQWRSRRAGTSDVEPVHEVYDRITEETLGVLVFQEQILKLFKELAGLTAAEADGVRKKIGKKLGLGDEADRFIAGSVAAGMEEGEAKKLMKSIMKFGEYAFGKSHSAAYATIAWWEMWCKRNYPIEFVWALMKNAEKREEAMSYVKEARRLGIVILHPDINESGANWTITNDNTIRAGLSSIKGIGTKAVEAVVERQPYSSLGDMLDRVDGRSASSRTIEGLAKAKALQSLGVVTRSILERKKKLKRIRTAKKENWSDEVDLLMTEGSEYDDETILQLLIEVAPQGAGVHPLSLYKRIFAGALKEHEWNDYGDYAFWMRSPTRIYGLITETRFRQVGDFDTTEPSELEKLKTQHGRRYAVIHIEDENGAQLRLKLEPDVYDRFKHVVERGAGTPIAAFIGTYRQSARIVAMIDLEEMRHKIRLNVQLNIWERCFVSGRHPVSGYSKKSFKRPRKSRGVREMTGLVCYVKRTIDKNGNWMAFATIQDSHANNAEIMVFASTYETHGDHFEPGRIIRIQVKPGREGGFILTDEGVVRDFGEVT